jgi:hypothetical protein
MPFVVCSAMSNFGQNKKDLATQPIEVESEKGKSICAKPHTFSNHCNDSEKEELKIISFLNCLGYIEFDFVCDLNSLENELFQKSGLLYLDYCTFHAIGLYDE